MHDVRDGPLLPELPLPCLLPFVYIYLTTSHSTHSALFHALLIFLAVILLFCLVVCSFAYTRDPPPILYYPNIPPLNPAASIDLFYISHHATLLSCS